MEQSEYVALVRKKHPKLRPIDVERSILRHFDWGKPLSPFGETYTSHLLRYITLLAPDVEHNPFFIRMIGAYEDARRNRRKIVNFIGSQNSGKTDTFATLAVALTSIDPEYTACFCAAPFLTAAESGLWGRIVTRANGIIAANPEMWKEVKNHQSKNRITFPGSHAEAGFIELRTLDRVGKLQGKKSFNPLRGMLLLFCDEIALFPTNDLLDLLDNLQGNPNFFCGTGCNFKSIDKLDGLLCEPEGREYSALDPDVDQEWESAYSSYTYRFDGHLSPNVLSKTTIYPYLLTEERRAAMELQHGLNGPKYLEQIRSFPNTSMSDYFVTSREKLRAGGVFDEFIAERGRPTRVAFCDPGFGGDPCRIGLFEYVTARLQATDGQFYTHQVFQPVRPIDTILVDARMEADDEWIARCAALNPGASLRGGSQVTIESQIAVQVAEFLDRHGVPRSHFGYDGSMRASIVQEMATILGPQVHALDYGGPATERETFVPTADPEKSRNRVARETFTNFNSELWFEAASVIQAGQLRGGELIPAALTQLCRRSWSFKGDRRAIERKEDYKAANQGRSPDDADVLVGAIEIARRHGFRFTPKRQVGQASSLLDRIRAMGQDGRLSRANSKLSAAKLHSR